MYLFEREIKILIDKQIESIRSIRNPKDSGTSYLSSLDEYIDLLRKKSDRLLELANEYEREIGRVEERRTKELEEKL